MIFEIFVRIVGFFGLCVLNKFVICGRLLVIFFVFIDFCGICVNVLFMLIFVLLLSVMIVLFGKKYCVGIFVLGIKILLLFVFIKCNVGCKFLFVVVCLFIFCIMIDDKFVNLLV